MAMVVVVAVVATVVPLMVAAMAQRVMAKWQSDRE